jgi:hypothetical protein
MKQLLILVCALGWLMTACNSDKFPGCFMPAGKAIHKEIPVPGGFHTIAIFDDIHLEIHPGQDNNLVLQGGENLLEHVEITVQDSLLSIRNHNMCNWMRNLEHMPILRIHSHSIRNIQYSGSGDIVFADTLFQDYFTLEVWDGYGQISPIINARAGSFKLHSGAATMTPAGKVETADIWAASHGRFDGRRLETRRAYIQHRSGNHAFVWARDSLLIRLLSTGNLYFRGNPEVRLLEHTGSGGAYPFP